MHFKLSNYLDSVSSVILSLKDEESKIKKISNEILQCRKTGNKVLLAGNGGSCADIEHFGGELICTFSKRNRKPISAQILTGSSSAITAWGNDFDFKTFFERQILANGKKNDLLIILSTGGGNLRKDIQGIDEIELYYKKVSSIQFREGSSILPGTLTFSFPGKTEYKKQNNSGFDEVSSGTGFSDRGCVG